MANEISRGEVAYQKLKAAIKDGSIRPGTRLREAEIAERFKVSRTPARDAIRRLEAERLISFVPRHGAVVSKLDHQETMELYDLREVLEGTAAAFAARHASEAEIEELRELVGSEEAIAASPQKLADLNRLFHSVLYRAAHNRYLERALIALRDSMALLGGTSLTVPGRYESAHEEHCAIIAAIAGRDAAAADAAARTHIRSAQRARLKMMREDMLAEAAD
ncbi:GntR family transcriptional regulator [Jiella endophytica]|uniref:GntR family transcriptional regulator n=1 Tax=Jiella endophytica TaxID=2558362 RepID=A0A4Y8RRZ7_9HYPH|nr:GntR family transcriptional regulator [Jiella endophytica]TFF25477.1 GntR family transcriptional regulator [Jiella endophytica]